MAPLIQIFSPFFERLLPSKRHEKRRPIIRGVLVGKRLCDNCGRRNSESGRSNTHRADVARTSSQNPTREPRSMALTFDAENLLQRVQSGDRDAESQLMARYETGVRLLLQAKVTNPTDREDLAQEIFIALLKKAREGEIHEPEKLNGFIRSLALNLIANHFRNRYRREASEKDNRFETPTVAPFFDPLMERDATRAMSRLLDELPMSRDREILIRTYYWEQDKDVICTEMNLSTRHFHRVIGRARSRFRTLLENRRESSAVMHRAGSRAQIFAAVMHRFAPKKKKTDPEVR